jgi:hypothetical protein
VGGRGWAREGSGWAWTGADGHGWAERGTDGPRWVSMGVGGRGRASMGPDGDGWGGCCGLGVVGVAAGHLSHQYDGGSWGVMAYVRGGGCVYVVGVGVGVNELGPVDVAAVEW